MEPDPLGADAGVARHAVQREAARHRRHGAHPRVVGIEDRQPAGREPFHQLPLGGGDRIDRAQEADVREADVEDDADGGRSHLGQLADLAGT